MALEPWQEADLKAHWEELTRIMKENHVPTSCDKDFPVSIKHDGLKPRFDLLPWDALAEVTKVYQFGKTKYSPRNWEKGFSWLRLWNAAMRHLTAWESGETLDPETKLSHTVHAAFCILGLVAHELRSIGTDDRHPPVAAGQLQPQHSARAGSQNEGVGGTQDAAPERVGPPTPHVD